MDEELERARQAISETITNGDFVLPSMPEVALRVREVAEDDEVDAQSISKIIGTDAALAATMIKVSNSALFSTKHPSTNLVQAITRMGIRYSCTLAIGAAMEQLFQSTSEGVDDRLRASWRHSTNVASLCHVYCKTYTRLKPDQASLAGLVHEIGKLPILFWADDLEWDDEVIDELITSLHPSIGQLVLKEWAFPEELRIVPAEYLNLTREADEPDYTDLVTVANLHACAGKDHPLGHVDLAGVSAFQRLGIDIEEVVFDSDSGDAFTGTPEPLTATA